MVNRRDDCTPETTGGKIVELLVQLPLIAPLRFDPCMFYMPAEDDNPKPGAIAHPFCETTGGCGGSTNELPLPPTAAGGCEEVARSLIRLVLLIR